MSGRKNSIVGFALFNAVDMSQASQTSGIVNIQNLDNIGIQCDIVSGTPSGTFSVQVSNTVNLLGSAVATWVEITNATVTSGSPANTFFDINQTAGTFMRLVYTRSAGSGSLNAAVSAKML